MKMRLVVTVWQFRATGHIRSRTPWSHAERRAFGVSDERFRPGRSSHVTTLVRSSCRTAAKPHWSCAGRP